MAPDHQESEIGPQEGSQGDWQPARFASIERIRAHFPRQPEAEHAHKLAGQLIRIKRIHYRPQDQEGHESHEKVIIHPEDLKRLTGRISYSGCWTCLDCILTD
jgi:hypothetical protein